MTPAQLATFKTAILADANLAAYLSARNDGAITDYYNQPGAGTIWRPSISIAELNTAILWNEYITLSVQFQGGYLAMIANGVIDATSANIRSGFASIFTGKTSLTNLSAIAQVIPTRFEALFTTSQVCSVFGKRVTVQDVVLTLTGV